MGDFKFMMRCTFCEEQTGIHSIEILGWVPRYEFETDIEDAFCPKHSGAQKFLDDQCAGCVTGFGECGLSTAMFSLSGVTEKERLILTSGVCPFRANGTFSFNNAADAEFKDIDISKISGAGIAILKGIDDFREIYSKCLRNHDDDANKYRE